MAGTPDDAYGLLFVGNCLPLTATDEHTSDYHLMMDQEEKQALLQAIDAAKASEDRAWAIAAEMRTKGVSDMALMSAIRLVEASTSKRMTLEAQLAAAMDR